MDQVRLSSRYRYPKVTEILARAPPDQPWREEAPRTTVGSSRSTRGLQLLQVVMSGIARVGQHLPFEAMGVTECCSPACRNRAWRRRHEADLAAQSPQRMRVRNGAAKLRRTVTPSPTDMPMRIRTDPQPTIDPTTPEVENACLRIALESGGSEARAPRDDAAAGVAGS